MATSFEPRGVAPSGKDGPVHNIEHSGFNTVADPSKQDHSGGTTPRVRISKAVTGAVASALLVLVVLRFAVAPDQVAPMVSATRSAFAMSLIVTALLLLSRWRFLDMNSSAWMAFGLFTLGVYLQSEAYLHFDGPIWENTDWENAASPVDLVVMGIAVFAARAAAAGVRADGWRHPLALGLMCSVLLVTARSVVVHMILPEPSKWLTLVIMAGFVVTVVLCAREMRRIHSMPAKLRWHLMVPVVIGTAYFQFFTDLAPGVNASAIIGTIVGAAATIHTFSAGLALMQDGHDQQRRQLADLAERAHEAEAVVDHDEELLHECRATVAGLSAASQLLATASDRMEQEQVTALQTMVEAEMLRLQAVLADSAEAPATERTFALDDLLSPLVLSLRSQGVHVNLRPTKLRARGDHNMVSTAVHVLLCNAKRHAPGAHITIWATARRDHIVLHVEDDGPGLPPEMTDRLFTRGARGINSPGQGLGLHSARKGLLVHGGDLAVVPTNRGARFALTIPRAI